MKRVATAPFVVVLSDGKIGRPPQMDANLPEKLDRLLPATTDH